MPGQPDYLSFGDFGVFPRARHCIIHSRSWQGEVQAGVWRNILDFRRYRYDLLLRPRPSPFEARFVWAA